MNRTDIAHEAYSALENTSNNPGFHETVSDNNGYEITRFEITCAAASKQLGKPIGKYITINIDKHGVRGYRVFSETVKLMSDELSRLLKLRRGESVLVIGLGNRAITSDAIGPAAVENIMVTAHAEADEYSVTQTGDDTAPFRPVFAFSCGVLGSTGIESSRSIAALTREIKPDRVIVIDALCTGDTKRICGTVQITNTGIVPGSGVGNSRKEISEKTIGVPVLAVGVPTVSESGIDGMIITPRDIDAYVVSISKLIGYAVNLALHEELDIADIDMYLMK